jgi:hypothetical protein
MDQLPFLSSRIAIERHLTGQGADLSAVDAAQFTHIAQNYGTGRRADGLDGRLAGCGVMVHIIVNGDSRG